MPDTISFARGAPSLDIIDVEGLKEAAARAFANDPGGTTAYGTSIGYVPLRAWIAEHHDVDPAQLLDLAREHDFVIFEDDPYVALRFSGETLPTMLSLDRDDTVVYASSFSKTVCPGIRVGYLVGPTELIAAIAKRATNTYISPNMV